jgi:replicative superfamily II helicase
MKGFMKLSEVGFLNLKPITEPAIDSGITLQLITPKKAIKTVIEKVEWDGKQIPTSEIEDLKYPFEYLNPVQSEFYVNRFLDANFIVSARTSAGKTVIAELARNGKLLYLSPLKAISQEKRDDWTDAKHTWSNLRVSISTGDYQLTPDRVQEMRNADVIVMTSEMLDSRSRNMEHEKNDWLKQIDTLVIDEFHLIGYKGRGDKLESAIIRFTEQNPNCRIICLSATMPNVEDLAEWLTKLNNKQTVIINSDYRPVELNRHYEQYLQARSYADTENMKIYLAKQIVNTHPNEKFIVFVHTKATGQKLLNSFSSDNIKAEFHNADLDKETRISIQAQFNSNSAGSLRVLIATSTLAWGVNTPADSVVVTGLHRGLNLIDNQDIHQMCGRAGRVGKTATGVGNAYILIPQKDSQSYIDWCDKIYPIKSKMDVTQTDGIATLCFHVIAEIMTGYITNADSLLKWYERTLARHQGIELNIDNANEILDKLEEIKMIRKGETGNYYVTGLGRVSGNLYYSPFDIYSWYMNFYKLFSNNIELNSVTLAWALCNITTYDIGYIPQPAQDEACSYENKLRMVSLFSGNTAYMCAAAYHLLNGSEDFPFGLAVHKRQLQADFDRMSIALKMIDGLYGRWKKDELWEQLKYQIKYGVKGHLLELVKLPQIGAVRAKKLYGAGIKNKQDFINKGHIARGIITTALYDKIINAISD